MPHHHAFMGVLISRHIRSMSHRVKTCTTKCKSENRAERRIKSCIFIINFIWRFFFLPATMAAAVLTEKVDRPDLAKHDSSVLGKSILGRVFQFFCNRSIDM